MDTQNIQMLDKKNGHIKYSQIKCWFYKELDLTKII